MMPTAAGSLVRNVIAKFEVPTPLSRPDQNKPTILSIFVPSECRETKFSNLHSFIMVQEALVFKFCSQYS